MGEQAVVHREGLGAVGRGMRRVVLLIDWRLDLGLGLLPAEDA